MANLSSEEKLIIKKQSYLYRLVLSVFAAICFATSTYFSLFSGEGRSFKQTISPLESSEIGPIEILKDNSVYYIEVRQPVSVDPRNFDQNTWSFVQGELLDHNKEFLFGFGDEFWAEIDEGETYSKTKYSFNVTFPVKGAYYLRFQSEAKKPKAGETRGNITVSLKPMAGSPTSHFYLGFFALLGIAAIWYFSDYRSKDDEDKKRISNISDESKIFIGLISCVMLFIFAEFIC